MEHPRGAARPGVEDSNPVTTTVAAQESAKRCEGAAFEMFEQMQATRKHFSSWAGLSNARVLVLLKALKSELSLSVSQMGRKRFHLRQNMQKHSEEPLGLAEFGEAVSSTKSFSLPGSQRFQASPHSKGETFTHQTPHYTKTFLCAALSHLPDSAPSSSSLSPPEPLQKPPCTTPCLQGCRGVRRGRVKKSHHQQQQFLSFSNNRSHLNHARMRAWIICSSFQLRAQAFGCHGLSH